MLAFTLTLLVNHRPEVLLGAALAIASIGVTPAWLRRRA